MNLKMLALAALLAAWVGAPADACDKPNFAFETKQDKPKDKEKDKDKDKDKKDAKDKHSEKKGPEHPLPGDKCGKDLRDLTESYRKKGEARPEDCEAKAKGHLKDKHADGRCHCECPSVAEKKASEHPRTGDKCGKDLRDLVEAYRKKSEGRVEDCEAKAKGHLKDKHADGRCHCECPTSGPTTPERPKGNNGVGNGPDPQPPGNPPVNDGPGTGPGNPGNRGGARR